MIQLESMPELIQQRQEYLRSLAVGVAVARGPVTLREAVGQLVIRFGRWVEGRRPDVTLEAQVARSYQSA